ncbi:MAG: branched-chain amino acid ABC transporter permease, partial [Oscillospiraceae bacterium]
MKQKKALKSYLVNIVAITAIYAILMVLMSTGVINSFYQGILAMIGINIIMAASLNLATGFLGQLALGHAGFMSVGAYASTLFVRYATGIPENVRFIASLLLGALVAAVVGLIVGIPALRLKGDYLAIITLGFGEIIRVIIENLGFTGGAQGLTKIPQLTSFTTVYIIVIITLVVLYSFIRSRHGRAVMAIREDSIAAESCGINITFYRTLAFTLSAAFAGIAGGLYAHQVGVLSAKVFGFNKSIEYVVMVVLGGMGSI